MTNTKTQKETWQEEFESLFNELIRDHYKRGLFRKEPLKQFIQSLLSSHTEQIRKEEREKAGKVLIKIIKGVDTVGKAHEQIFYEFQQALSSTEQGEGK